MVKEYQLYLIEDRPSVRVDLKELDSDWTEDALRKRFKGNTTRCGADHTGTPGVSRTCTIDLSSFNGVPAMYVNFLFSKGELTRVAVSVPWWRHGSGLDYMLEEFGKPDATQEEPRAGVRLHGWKLEGGGAIFYIRDRGLNPLDTSSIQWTSAKACGVSPCIR